MALVQISVRIGRRYPGVALLALLLFTPTAGAATAYEKHADGLVVYLGVLPAQVLRGPGNDHLATMHGGFPSGTGSYHVVISVSDEQTGNRAVTLLASTITQPILTGDHHERRRAARPRAMGFANEVCADRVPPDRRFLPARGAPAARLPCRRAPPVTATAVGFNVRKGFVMNTRISTLALVFILAVTSSCAQDGAEDRVIVLQDGGRVVLRGDGAMSHYDAAGRPVTMEEGQPMIAIDGSRIMMRSDTLWREIIEGAAYIYGLSFRVPGDQSATNKPRIELADGGWIMLQDGSMVHFNARGDAIRMADGDVMLAKDGTKVLMNNGALWGSTPSGKGKGTTR